jgi:putative nucleotidyltransferase with HDIG domain
MNRIDEATDKAASLIKETATRYNILPAFMKNDLVQKGMILAGLSLILAIVLTPQIPLMQHAYKVGQIAKKDIRADRDFLAVDRNSTEVKKLEAMEKVQSIYDYDSSLPAHIKANLSKAFVELHDTRKRAQKNGSDLTAGLTYSEDGRANFEKTIGTIVSADEFNALIRNKFAPAFATKMGNLIRAVYNDNRFITAEPLPKQDREKGIIVRDIRTNAQEKKKDLGNVTRVEEIRPLIPRYVSIFFGHESTDHKSAAIMLAAKLVQPNLTYNKDASEQLKMSIMDSVEPVYFQVQNNEIIVREGEKISITTLDMLEGLYKRSSRDYLSLFWVFLGMLVIIMFLASGLYYLSKDWFKKRNNMNKDLLFLAVAILMQCFLVKLSVFLAAAVNRAFPSIPAEACYYAIPFAVGAMLTGILINRNISLVFAVLSSFLVTFLIGGRTDLAIFSLIGSLAAVYHIDQCRKRSAFFRAGFFLGLINVVVVFFVSLLSGKVPSLEIFLNMFLGFVGGISSGFIVAGVSPLFENFFGYTTDIKLLEQSNLNQPIFQRMLIEAPGTYHHSIITGSLAEAAAEAIGANPLLAKVSAYYHDIGKIKKASYFIENQREGENRHDRLTPKMSSLVIISHIKDGCELAQEAKLGKEITNIIRQHHGTSLVSYFYEKARKDKDPSTRSLPESDFRYPGPKPQTKEAGIVLLGDVMEASSRTLSNPTPARINHLVKERIERVFADGQLDECELTLHDLNKIADTFARILNGIFHHRIDYPELVRPVTTNGNGTKKEVYAHPDRKQAERKDRSA